MNEQLILLEFQKLKSISKVSKTLGISYRQVNKVFSKDNISWIRKCRKKVEYNIDYFKTIDTQKECIKHAKLLRYHFTAPNVKDDWDNLIMAMKEEILILRANVKQLENEQQKECLSVEDTYQFMCDHIEWQGNNAPNLRKLANNFTNGFINKEGLWVKKWWILEQL